VKELKENFIPIIALESCCQWIKNIEPHKKKVGISFKARIFTQKENIFNYNLFATISVLLVQEANKFF
jgi:hypothetical protein